MVAVVVGEAEPVVERAGGRVVRLDLEVRGGRPLVVRPPGERAHHGGGQAAPALVRCHLDGAEQRPGPLDHGPADRARRGGEPDRRPARDHLERGVGEFAGAVVRGEPGRVRGARQLHRAAGGLGQGRQRGERGGTDQGVRLAHPPRAVQLHHVGRGVRHLEQRHEPALLVPPCHRGERFRRRHPRVARQQHGVRAAGETARRAQHPAAQRRRLHRRPGPRRHRLDLLGRHRGHSRPAPAPVTPLRSGRHHLPRHQCLLLDPHRLSGPPSDADHSRIPGCENTDRIGEHRMPVGDLDQLPDRDAFSHVSGGNVDFESSSGRENPSHACPSCSERAQERRY